MPRVPYKVQPVLFRAAQAEQITGIPAQDVRNWRRRGHLDSFEGQATFEAYDLAQFLFIATCREAGLQLAEIWDLANDKQVIGAIVAKAGRMPGTITDNTGHNVFRASPTWRTWAAQELAGGNAVSHDDLVVWHDRAKPTLYSSSDSDKLDKLWATGKVIHVLSMQKLAEILAQRAPILATMMKAGD